jgi:hypothetical protein
VDERLTTRPVDGAGPLIVTLPVEEAPGLIDAGLSVIETKVGGVIVSEPDLVIVPSVALIVTVV